MRKALLLFMVLVPALAWGQGSCVLFPAQLTTGAALTDATSNICTKGTSANACVSGVNAVNVFSDETMGGGFALTQPVHADSGGNTYVCVAPGTYEICTNSPRASGPYCWNQQFYATGGSTGAVVSSLLATPVTGTTIDFGTVSLPGGPATEQTIALANTGTVGVGITTPVLSDTTNFSMTTNNCPPTLSTTGANSCTIGVSCTPSSAAAFSATLTITTTASNNTTLSYPLTCTGTSVAAPTLTSLSISPASPSVARAANQQLNAFYNFNDGSSVQAVAPINYVTWLTSAPGTAQITSTGSVTGVAAGTATITANAGNVINVAAVQNGNNGVTSVSVALQSNIAKGATIIVIPGWGATTGSITSVTDSCGNSYTIRSALTQANGVSQAIYDSENIANACASDTVTVAFGASTNIVDLRAVVVTGLNGVDVECHNSGAAATTAQCAASATASQANDFAIAGATVSTAVTGASAGATQIKTASPYLDASQYQALTASGSFPFSATLTSGNFIWNEILYKTIIANATTTVTVTGGAATTFSIQSQPPITNVPYAQTMFAKQLPADVDSHRWANNGFGFSGDQIILHIWPLQLSGNGGYSILCGVSGVANLPGNCSGSIGGGIYYASQSDPVYQVKSVVNPPSNSSLNPAGKFFHLTNQAKWGGKVGGGNDQFLFVWDQSSDIDSTAGGRFFTSYYGNGGSPGALPNCTCTTTACAAVTTSCQISLYYAALGYPSTDTQGFNEAPQGWDTLNAASGIMDLRNYEWMPNGQIAGITSGTVNHAIFANTACTANGGGVVFPAVGSGAHKCDGTGGFPTDTERPLVGNLFYIDSGYNCAASAAAWAVPLCVEMQTFGAYVTDTGGGNGNTLINVSRIEEAYAYDTAGLTDPVFAYLRGQSSTCGGQTCLSVDSTFEKATIFFFQGMPGLINVGGGTTHLHIADPCIARGLAGQTSAQGACF